MVHCMLCVNGIISDCKFLPGQLSWGMGLWCSVNIPINILYDEYTGIME